MLPRPAAAVCSVGYTFTNRHTSHGQALAVLTAQTLELVSPHSVRPVAAEQRARRLLPSYGPWGTLKGPLRAPCASQIFRALAGPCGHSLQTKRHFFLFSVFNTVG